MHKGYTSTHSSDFPMCYKQIARDYPTMLRMGVTHQGGLINNVYALSSVYINLFAEISTRPAVIQLHRKTWKGQFHQNKVKYSFDKLN